MILAEGQMFGGFQIVAKLGQGGMGAVYRARELQLQRDVALKVLPADVLSDTEAVLRFERESRLIASLEHPNIVPVNAVGIHEGLPWMSLRLVAGGTLANVLRQERGLQAGSFRVLYAIAGALDFAHERGVLHRDLKPQNILIGRNNEVYLADFGIAKLMSQRTALTAAGVIMGTPHYMSPEQAQGLALGPASDLYALAIIAYEWACGLLPFEGESPLVVLYKHVNAAVPEMPLSDLPEGLRAALQRGLAKLPEQRFSSASELVDAIEQGWNGVGIGSAMPREPKATDIGHREHPSSAAAQAAPALPAVIENRNATTPKNLGAKGPLRARSWRIVAILVTLSIAITTMLLFEWWPTLQQSGKPEPLQPAIAEPSRIEPAVTSVTNRSDKAPSETEAAPAALAKQTLPSSPTTEPAAIPVSSPSSKAVQGQSPSDKKRSYSTEQLQQAYRDMDAQRYAVARPIIESAALDGIAEAQARMGSLYFRGWSVKKDVNMALNFYELGARGGYVLAARWLGALYEKSADVPGDPKKSTYWFTICANAGDAFCHDSLARRAMIAGDKAEGLRWLRSATELKHPHATYQLGKAYIRGDGVPQDTVKGNEYLRQAAALGDDWAAYELANPQ